MQALVSAPEQIGQKVAAALVGTFLASCCATGGGPAGSHLDASNQGRAQLLQCIHSGCSPTRAAQPAAGGRIRPALDSSESAAVVRRDVGDVPARGATGSVPQARRRK